MGNDGKVKKGESKRVAALGNGNGWVKSVRTATTAVSG